MMNIKSLENDGFKGQLDILDEKIRIYEEKLGNLQMMRDNILQEIKQRKELLEKPLEDAMNSDNFEIVQDKYMKNRMKRISLNSIFLFKGRF